MLNERKAGVGGRSACREAYMLSLSTCIYRHSGFGVVSAITARLSNSAVW